MARKSDEFDSLVLDILNKNEYRELKNELHHGISRSEHSLRVSKATYKITKKLHLNYKDATRAAMLHDFYLDYQFEGISSKKVLNEHPSIALENAKKYFDINEMQENMIESHMYPLGSVKPKSREAWVLTTVDKGVAAYEMYRFKASLALSVFMLFLFNIITLNK